MVVTRESRHAYVRDDEGTRMTATEAGPLTASELDLCRAYTREYGEDAPEITEWKWDGQRR